MNQHVGFIKCPGCEMPWSDGQWACCYCGGTELPPAIKPAGPAWAWWLAAGVLLFAWLIDRNFGGHGWRIVRGWLDAHG